MLKIEELNLHWLNKIFLIILFFSKAFSFEEAFSQSYILNGDFEKIEGCPKFWSVKDSDFKVAHWYSPSKATPDYFSTCSESCNNENNWIQKNTKSTSSTYVGLITQQDRKNYSEYIQTKLSQPLEEGKFYRVKMDVYWPEGSKVKPVELEILMSQSKIYSKKESYISATHAVKSSFEFNKMLKSQWYSIEFEFQAKGKESYLTIGNFDRSNSLVMDDLGEYDYNYLFIDNVELYPFEYQYQESRTIIGPNVISSFEYLDDVTESHLPGNCTCWNCQILNGEVDKDVSKLETLADFVLKKGQRIDLNRVIFDYQNGELLPKSNNELNRLLFVLEEQPAAELRFIIYTYEKNDNGKAIAKESALSIYQYLKNKGLQNSFSYIHATKESLSQDDGVPRDRNIEMYVVNNN